MVSLNRWPFPIRPFFTISPSNFRLSTYVIYLIVWPFRTVPMLARFKSVIKVSMLFDSGDRQIKNKIHTLKERKPNRKSDLTCLSKEICCSWFWNGKQSPKQSQFLMLNLTAKLNTKRTSNWIIILQVWKCWIH